MSDKETKLGISMADRPEDERREKFTLSKRESERERKMSETDTNVKEIVDEWRERADLMERHIEDPNERQRFVMGFFRARANELEARLLNSDT